MKPQHFAVVIGLLLVLALALILPGRSAVPGAADQVGIRTLTVVGEGGLSVRADQAEVSFGVWTYGVSAAQAEALNVASVEKIQRAIVAAGADERSIVVTLLTVADSAPGGAGDAPSGAQRRITAMVRNMSKVQDVVRAGLNAGATSVESVRYSLSEPEPTRQQAVAQALQNARDRANALARAQGIRLDELIATEVIDSPGVVTASSPGGLLFQARVRATFRY